MTFKILCISLILKDGLVPARRPATKQRNQRVVLVDDAHRVKAGAPAAMILDGGCREFVT